MASSRAISAGDPQAVEKLNARLQECREYQVQSANGKHFFLEVGRHFFSWCGSQFFLMCGREFFSYVGRHFFLEVGREFFLSVCARGAFGW